MEINERQKKILIAVITEFMRTAEEVGSVHLVEKYSFNFSPATVRSEMVKLMDQGLLEQSHLSAGRVPTDQAIRMYIHEKLGEKMLNSLDVVQIKQGLFKVRFDSEQLVKEALNLLVKYSSCASFMIMDDTSRYYGVSSLMKYKELRNVDIMERILDLLEDQNILKSVFSKYMSNDVAYIIGSELGIKDMENCSMVFVQVPFWGNKHGHMGLIGSRRMDYFKAANLLDIVKGSLTDFLKGW